MATRTTSEPDMPPVVLTASALHQCHLAAKSDDEAVRSAGETVMSYLSFGMRMPQLVLPVSCTGDWDLIKDL